MSFFALDMRAITAWAKNQKKNEEKEKTKIIIVKKKVIITWDLIKSNIEIMAHHNCSWMTQRISFC